MTPPGGARELPRLHSAGATWPERIGPGFLVALALLGSGALWYQTVTPLARPYGFGVGLDRIHNLANSQVVAAGNSPFETFQVGQRLPPGRPHWIFWDYLVALLSGFEPARAFAVYDLVSLLTALGWPLAVFLALRPSGGMRAFSGWEAALAAFFAALLASQPLDFSGPFRDPWALNFLLKPNHTLSLVLAPLLLRGFAQVSSWRGRILLALGVLLMGGMFLLHQAYLCLGLLAFLALSWALRRPDRRASLLDVGAVLGLAAGVGIVALGPSLRLGQFLEPSLEVIPGFAPVGLDLTVGTGWLFYAATVGAWVCLRRPGRLGLLLVGQWIAAYAIAAAYWPARWMHLVRSVDEVYYWIRFHTAILAGVGALSLVRWGLARLSPSYAHRERLAALVLCAAVLPHTQPLWWVPGRMDAYYRASLEPLPEDLVAAAAFLREATPGTAVVAADPSRSIFIAALSGRRVLLSDVNPPVDHPARRAILSALVEDAGRDAVAAARAAGVTHLVLAFPRGAEPPFERYAADSGFERLFSFDSGAGAIAVVFRLFEAPAP